MADTSIREKVVGFEKESVRLTLENATKWIAPEGGTEFQVERELLADNAVRDIKSKFPSVPGRKSINGTIVNLPVEMDNNMGDLFFAALGKTAGAGSDETNGGYSHVLTPATVLIPPTYSFHIDRGATLGVKGYNGCLITKLTLNQAANERLMMNADIIGIDEAAGTIGSPSFSNPNPFTFDDISTLTIGGVDHKANIMSYTLNIANQAKLKNVLDGNDIASDIIAPDSIVVDGTVEIFFTNLTERDKFVAGTSSDIVITYEGDIIGGAIPYKLIADIHKVEYTAFPFGDIEGLFGASMAFQGVYSTGDTELITVTIWNTQSASY